jgi:anti-sigma factor RsiW
MDDGPAPTAAPSGASARPDPDTCAAVVELVTEYLEDALDPAIRARFEKHLADCDPCSTYLAQMRETIALVGRVHLDRVAPATLERLVAAFRSAGRA